MIRNKLRALADHLDVLGLTREADHVDVLLRHAIVASDPMNPVNRAESNIKNMTGILKDIIEKQRGGGIVEGHLKDAREYIKQAEQAKVDRNILYPFVQLVEKAEKTAEVPNEVSKLSDELHRMYSSFKSTGEMKPEYAQSMKKVDQILEGNKKDERYQPLKDTLNWITTETVERLSKELVRIHDSFKSTEEMKPEDAQKIKAISQILKENLANERYKPLMDTFKRVVPQLKKIKEAA